VIRKVPEELKHFLEKAVPRPHECKLFVSQSHTDPVSLFWLFAIIHLAAFAQVAQSNRENPTPGQLAAFDKLMNRASLTQVAIKQVRVFLELYQQELGKWPDSWVAVEHKFGAEIWESPEVRQSFTKSFVLLRGVPGHINTREEGEYDSTMMMVMAAPIERKFGQDKYELGRWAVWKTFRGQIVTRWHPEAEIMSFSGWPDVQSVITQHIKTVVKNDETSQAHQLGKTAPIVQPPAPQRVPEFISAPPPSEQQSSSAPWSIIVVLIVASTGLLWLLLKKRR